MEAKGKINIETTGDYLFLSYLCDNEAKLSIDGV
jgi:hypothetical protein